MSLSNTHPLELAIKQFHAHFETAPQYYFQAPGRINLLGEHTDYNNGFVLPCAINRGTYLSVAPNGLNQFRVIACDIHNELSQWKINSSAPFDTEHNWANYLRGVHAEFLQQGFICKYGLDITIAGNIPQGAGLSSSASVSVAFATALVALNNWVITPAKIAQICRAAENNFVGCLCGIMDQLSSTSGKAGKALLIDCADLTIRHISMPPSLALMIIDSKIKRGLVQSEYNTRRKQCEEAAGILGVNSLREAHLEHLFAAQSTMPAAVFKRAHHIITENSRTLAAAEALDNNNVPLLSKLMAASHASMRDDFAITVAPIDLLVQWVYEVVGERGGARMTGGGFGGCVVALVPHELCSEVGNVIQQRYSALTGHPAKITLVHAADGAGAVHYRATVKGPQKLISTHH